MFLIKTKIMNRIINNIRHNIRVQAINLWSSILLVALLLVASSSCTDFLEVEPYSTIDPEFFLDSEPNAELALAGVYNVLNAGDINGEGNAHTFRRGLLFMLNASTDECAPNNKNPQYEPYMNFSYQSTDVFGRYAWLFFYAGITRANSLLEGIDNITFETEGRKEQIKAEARFLRGIYYQYLVWMYGGVPLTLSTNDPNELERSSLETVYESIEKDLLYAYNTLNPVSNISGRANKWSAAGYLAKMYLYLASCKENNVGAELTLDLNKFDWVNSADMYQKAYEVNSAIIGNKSLTPEYFHLFRTEKNDDTYDEVLFGVEAVNNQDVVMIYVNAFIPQGNVNTVGGGYGFMRPGYDLYAKYDRENDVRYANNLTGNLGGNPATRDEELIEGTRYYIPNKIPANMPAGYGLISIGKWRYPVPGTRAIEPWASDCNFQLVRYADILLMQAELELKHNNNETAARNYLTKVRERAAEYDQARLDAMTASYFKGDLMDEIMDERSRELCFETWRRFDLIRTGRMQSTIDNLSLTGHKYQPNMGVVKNNYEPYKIWFPIPDNEMAVNKLMVQNAGYVADETPAE
ncbi:RagB/SusD family nutrient uptake outer membrane protein [Labilibacter sediminis]|nr:RagB/SusD family nutrient uptake outer membrane protein [Labilibacter sediminis]